MRPTGAMARLMFERTDVPGDTAAVRSPDHPSKGRVWMTALATREEETATMAPPSETPVPTSLPERRPIVAKPHVVIVGGGFAGLNAAKGLKNAPVRVTLVDRRNHHLFQPLLYQVATAVVSPADIASPIRGILRKQKNARVLLADVALDRRRAQDRPARRRRAGLRLS